MFSPKVTSTDAFLDMPVSARELYFQLGMNADDDGFITPKRIMRMTGASEDDLRVLAAKNFVIPFQSGVIVISAWKVNNLVRKDWYQETIYKDEKARLCVANTGEYRLVNKMLPSSLTEVRLGKVSIGKNKTDFSDEKSDSSPSLQESEGGGGEEDIVVDYTVDEDGNPRRDGFGRARGPKDDIPRKARDLAQYYTKVLIQHHNIPSEVIIRGDAVIARLKKILKDNPSLTSKKLSEYILNFVKTADTAQDAANYIFMLSPMSITKWQIDNA